MNSDKELIKQEYLKLKEHFGRQPAAKEFYRHTGISEYQIVQNFHKYSSLTEEMGDIQKSFGEKNYDKEEYLNNYGSLIRQINKIPTVSDWQFHKCKPLVSSFKKKFEKNWTEMPNIFFEYAANRPEWEDVIYLCAGNRFTAIEKLSDRSNALELKYSQYIPPILTDFLNISMQEGRNNDFEKLVNLVFQMLGYETAYLGQGTGRNPDSIAKATQYGYALLIDAKARAIAYQMGTEDRKFIEYIKRHTTLLNRTGHQILYFVVVSSEFKLTTEIALKNIIRETNVVTTLITASTLLKLLAKKIENPSLLGLEALKELFLNPGIMTDKQLNNFLQRLSKHK
jgi:hypothetical protein